VSNDQLVAYSANSITNLSFNLVVYAFSFFVLLKRYLQKSLHKLPREVQIRNADVGSLRRGCAVIQQEDYYSHFSPAQESTTEIFGR
jgi:hypothetical protein